MTQPSKTSGNDIYRNGARVDRLPGEDPTTGDIYDSENAPGAAGPRTPGEGDEDYDDDENITGDEALYDSVENEEPADEEDVIDEQEDLEGDLPDVDPADFEDED